MMAKQQLFNVINQTNDKDSARPPYLMAQRHSSYSFFLKSGTKELKPQKVKSPNYSQSLISTNASRQQINFEQLLQKTQAIRVNRATRRDKLFKLIDSNKQLNNDDINPFNKYHRKLQWQGLDKWSFYQDYLFLRDPQFIGDQAKEHLLLRQQQEIRTFFSSPKDEKEYLDQKRRNDIEKIKEDYIFLFMMNKNSRNRSRDQLQKQGHQSIYQTKYNQFEKLSSEILDRIMAKVQAETIDEIEIHFNQLIDTLKNIAYFIECTILFLYRKYQQAYKVWKIYLRLCNSSGAVYYKYKLIAYKFMARCCQDDGDYDKSIVYLKKLLKLSWIQDNRDYEMLAYDMYSIVLYYRGEIEKSIYFHSKFVDGIHENKGIYKNHQESFIYFIQNKLIRFQYFILIILYLSKIIYFLDSKYRSVGETHYFLQGKYKERLQDQSSYSSDDFEIDLLTAHDAQKETLIEKSKSLKKLRDKLHLASKEDFKKIRDYNQKFVHFGKARHYNNNSDFSEFQIKDLINISNQPDEENKMSVLINQLSPNRKTSQHLLILNQQKKYQQHSQIHVDLKQSYINRLRMLIKLFKLDIQYFCQYDKLCEDPMNQF